MERGLAPSPLPQHNKILRLTTKSFMVRISELLSKQQDMHAVNKCKQNNMHKVKARFVKSLN